MAEILEYRTQQPATKSPSRGTLARASMVAALATSGLEAIAIALVLVIGRPAWLVLACGIPLFAVWFIAVVFGVIALLDRDGPRSLAAAALALAGGQPFLLLLVPVIA